ncbi:hypothetical protein LCGC14_1306410, partial [marine sediment metagenome]
DADEFKKWLHDTIDEWLSDFDPADEKIVLLECADASLSYTIDHIYYLAPPTEEE